MYKRQPQSGSGRFAGAEEAARQELRQAKKEVQTEKLKGAATTAAVSYTHLKHMNPYILQVLLINNLY